MNQNNQVTPPPSPSQQANQTLVSWITSDITKSIMAIVSTAIVVSFIFANTQNEIKTSLLEINHKIDMSNLMLENRMKTVEEKEDRLEKRHDSDMSFIMNNFARRGK